MASLSTFARCICRVVPMAVRSGFSQAKKQHIQPQFSWIIARGISAEIDPDDPRTIPNSEWEKKLTPEQYAVCREKNTEAPFSGVYVNHYKKGMYHCVCCDAELFSSDTKYDSSSGWPSFYEAYGTENSDERYSNVLRRHDNSCGMVRTEVICKKCDSHLGHVFEDGPKPTGQRFCINSASLKFRTYRPH